MCAQTKQEIAIQFIHPRFYFEKRMLKVSRKLLFSLFSYYSNFKNKHSKQALSCFLVHSATVLIRKTVSSKQVGVCFFIINQTRSFLLYTVTVLIQKCFYYEFYKTSANGKFLDYSSNFVRLLI